MSFDFDFNFDFSFSDETKLVVDSKHAGLQDVLSNFPFSFRDFCGQYLTIKPKSGGEISFIFNESQEKWYQFLLDNYKKHGEYYISFVTVKFRQNGISTISAAFAFYACLCNHYNLAFVGANAENTGNVFRIVDRHVHDLKNAVQENKRHSGRLLGINNFLMHFSVASGNTTRGLTIGCLISDEMGERTDEMDFEALSQVKNYVYLPLGTPKGTDNLLYLSYLEMQKTGDVLFLAWWQMQENTLEVTSQYKPLPEIERYLEKYALSSLSLGQKAWIEQKYLRIRTRSFTPEDVLNQEYPPNLQVGFEASAANCFCAPYYINFAFESKYQYNPMEAIVGIDIAGHGEDRSIMCVRFNNTAFFYELTSHTSEHAGFEDKALMAVNILIANFPMLKVRQINIDTTGVGEGFPDYIYKYTRKAKMQIRIVPVHFSCKVDVEVDFETVKQGVRDFMYFKLKRWLETCKVFLQPNQSLKEELFATQIKSINGREAVIPKEEIKKNLRRSPDYADALALSFVKDELPEIKVYKDEFLTGHWF